jgi:hypothetical protein
MMMYEWPHFSPRSEMQELAVRAFALYSERVHGTATPGLRASIPLQELNSRS